MSLQLFFLKENLLDLFNFPIIIMPARFPKSGVGAPQHQEKERKGISIPSGPHFTVKQNLVFDACYNKGGLHVVASCQDLH